MGWKKLVHCWEKFIALFFSPHALNAYLIWKLFAIFVLIVFTYMCRHTHTDIHNVEEVEKGGEVCWKGRYMEVLKVLIFSVKFSCFFKHWKICIQCLFLLLLYLCIVYFFWNYEDIWSIKYGELTQHNIELKTGHKIQVSW